MKKGNILIALVSSLFLGNTMVQAQVGLKRANQSYDNLAYYDALTTYEKIVNRGFVNADLLKNLGNSYYFNGEYEAANKWYSQLYTEFESEEIEPEYAYRYAETLKNIGENAKATSYFEKFAKSNSSSSRAKLIDSKVNSEQEIKQNSGRFNIADLAINSPYSDYGSSVYENKLLFTSARDTGNFSKRVFTWTGDAFTKIYASEIQSDGSLGKPTRIKGQVNSKFNESTPIITKDGQRMYFTRNNYNEKSRGYSEDKVTLLKIYQADLENGKWVNVKELPFNSNDFNTAHPVLNAQENMMYFVSDRPGGYGSSDIWRVSVSGNTFGQPENLGSTINTDGRESFPFMSTDDELYFASDARPGLGGLDIYVSKIKKDGSFTVPQNVGAPVNGPSDDFGYIIDKTSKRGFFSSNRSGGVGKDDIYQFEETRSLVLECIQNLKVLVVDSKTRNIITDAKLSLYDMNYNLKATSNQASSNSQYVFNTEYECGNSYRIKAELPDYVVKEEVVELGTSSGVTERTVVMERKRVEIKKDDDLFKKLDLLPIYFDFDKDNIRPDAAIELSKIVEVMKEYPQMKIDVRSYTDSRGNDAYNMKLSERRAKSTAQWIISQGISSSRVSYKGYGESKLLNHCSNGVKCSEEEHELNRRSEFIVTEM